MLRLNGSLVQWEVLGMAFSAWGFGVCPGTHTAWFKGGMG
jgi:hypothetical protein